MMQYENESVFQDIEGTERRTLLLLPAPPWALPVLLLLSLVECCALPPALPLPMT